MTKLKIYRLFAVLTRINARTDIFDYTNAEFVLLNTGEARVQTNTFNFIHEINIEKLQNMADTLGIRISRRIPQHNPSLPFLLHEHTQILNLIQRLKIKNVSKRAINQIGTVWKWISGSPDNSDLEILNNRMNDVLTNNNNQVITNRLIINKINEISNVTNNILGQIHSEHTDKIEIVFNLMSQLKILKEDLININYAIHWAKAGISNSILFGKQEIATLEKHMDYSFRINFEELLQFSDIKIVTNSSLILYIVKIPVIDSEVCKSILIKPIKQNQNVIREISFDNVIACNNEIYGIIKNCNRIENKMICKTKNIIKLNDDDCIKSLIVNQQVKCNKSVNDTLPNIERLSDDIIFLNKFNGTLATDSKILHLNGSFILTLKNSTVVINERNFSSLEESGYKPLPAILKTESSEDTFIIPVTVEKLEELHINNSALIDKIKIESRIGNISNFCLVTLLMLIISYILIFKIIKKKSNENSNISERVEITGIRKVNGIFELSHEDVRI